MSLPLGTVTFLFTDIEGSTRLWEQFPETMAPALARHDALLQTAVIEQNGAVVKTTGDGILAAFATAPDALQAALTAQQIFLTESWPAETPLRVRIALHTGVAQARDGDYYGQALNRAARLRDAAHGGQCLLSQSAYELARDASPPGVAFRDMGEHRLRDLARPERVYQILHSALPSEFPPLRSLDNPAFPNNLPLQTTSFIGREAALTEVGAYLQTHRLVTLTGSGGSGKTRLSLQVAAVALEYFPDGVWFVELAPLTDPALVPQQVAAALHLAKDPDKSFTETLLDALKSKNLLLVLDNCEHLLDAAARLTDALLHFCPTVKILASSREGFNIAGERTYRVPSLSLPDAGRLPDADALTHYEAVQLFIERTRLARPDFAVTNENAPALASVCARLDGIPLAIELAAARTRSLSIEEINIRLNDVFRLLTGGSRTALPRQQTLRAAIDWSYTLLSEPEQALFRRLAVFSGGWTLEAAEKVCASPEGSPHTSLPATHDILDLLTALADKSLVEVTEREGRTRYRFLITVRQYAQDCLTDAVESAATRDAHCQYFLHLAEQAEPHLQGARQLEWLKLLDAERDNLFAALEWALSDADRQIALRLTAALDRFWWARDWSTGTVFLERALRDRAEEPTAARAKALAALARFYQWEERMARAEELLHESLALYERLDDLGGRTRTQLQLGFVCCYRLDFDAARTFLEASLDGARSLKDAVTISTALNELGQLATYAGDSEKAVALTEESLGLARQIGAPGRIAERLFTVARAQGAVGDYRKAEESLRESSALIEQVGMKAFFIGHQLELATTLVAQERTGEARTIYDDLDRRIRESSGGNGWAVSRTLWGRGDMALTEGDPIAAQRYYGDALRSGSEPHRKLEILPLLAAALAANPTSARRDAALAARLMGAAIALKEVIPLPAAGYFPSPYKQGQAERAQTNARALLGDKEFEREFALGGTLTLEQAITDALQGGHDSTADV